MPRSKPPVNTVTVATASERVAIVQSATAADEIHLPIGSSVQVVLRTPLTAEGIELLASAQARVVILDLRGTCSTEVPAAMRLLRRFVEGVRVVAVTDPGDDATAQAAIATGAVAHLGQDLGPLALLRAVNAARRGAPCLGETGQRVLRRMRRDDEP